ncbi:MAG: 5-bromo-4-chloroindolyl phosphate hydrolysis family protein [Litoreibacter sp.]
MAQRFGGAHSPDGSDTTSSVAPPIKPQKSRARANVLAFVAIPLLFTAFGDGPFGLAYNISAFALIAGATWLTREGLEAEEAYNARTISRRPVVPRKMLGSLAVGAGVGLATLDGGLINSVLYGVIAAGLHAFSFGLDPLANKGVEGVDDFQSDRVARAVDEAEEHLARMMEAAKQSRDRLVIGRVEQFQTAVRKMCRTVENDPRDLTAVRRYLGVYLLGASDAATKFAALYTKTQDSGSRDDFTALLDDLQTNFTAKTDTLLLNNRVDLDIEIDVLRERLQREGVKIK